MRAWLALWNDVDPEVEDEYNTWHAEEHVPERLTVPGIRAAARYRGAAPGQVRYFTWYGLDGVEVLTSAAYTRLLAQPTAWSRRMRPHLRNLSRYVCRERTGAANRPGARIRPQLFPACEMSQAARAPLDGRVLVGEVDADAAPLPWAGASTARADVGWVRIETVADPFPGTYLLLHEFPSN